ncbi:hypothetical protein APHAL10511_002395 [Amanita phalloides]|nr:hypothetical protein APHAL10511_002395 [Amanita phalloides]
MSTSLTTIPPVIRAARNPNSLVLIAVLEEGLRLLNKRGLNKSSIKHNFSANTQITGAIHCLYNSPLVEAINARLPQNIGVLLAAGADPNGILLRDLDDYSGISDRRKTFSRFWTEPVLPSTFFRAHPARTALETASSVGDPALFDQARAAKPDESWWRVDSTPPQLPANLTHSDAPLFVGSRVFSEHSAPCRTHTVPSSHHPMTNPAPQTPVFSIHTLHFAAARLDLLLLQQISTSHLTMVLGAAGTTSLGHTLLHIAALPLTDDHINLFAPKIFSSIHDVRTLNAKRWAPNRLRVRHPARRTSSVLPPLCEETPEDEEGCTQAGGDGVVVAGERDAGCIM